MSISPPLLQYHIDGGEPGADNAANTVVLVHGFPDGPSVWTATSQYLRGQGYRVIRVALPGFENEPGHFVTPTFDETVARLYATLEHTGALGATLVGHDWGAIFLYRLLRSHPTAASRVVLLEIGAARASVLQTLFVLCYHALIVLACCLGSRLGDPLMRFICWGFPRPDYPHANRPCAHQGWLYRQAWREGSQDGPWHTYYRNGIAAWTPPADLPVLFLYGRDGLKWLRFHTGAWRQEVTSYNAASQSKALPGSHWFFVQHQAPFYEALDTFLSATDESTDKVPNAR